MKDNFRWTLIRYGSVFVILLVIQNVFNYVYKTDWISVLFGIFLLGISFIIHEVIDELIMRYRLNRLIKKLEKDLQDWEDSYDE